MKKLLTEHSGRYNELQTLDKKAILLEIADSVQTEYCTTFLLSVSVSVCHRRDISHFSHI